MAHTPCQRCGSTSFRADRALAGRLVCNLCGTPEGLRLPGNKRNYINLNILSKKRNFLILAIVVFLFILLIA